MCVGVASVKSVCRCVNKVFVCVGGGIGMRVGVIVYRKGVCVLDQNHVYYIYRYKMSHTLLTVPKTVELNSKYKMCPYR